MADVEFELLLTIALVVMVIFLFLRNLSATIIPSVAVPLSLVGTFGVMYLLGYSLNNLTLMALTISTGFVVDDAIVMIENITRYIEEGEGPLEAALKGAEQIGFTILSLTVSLIAVLIPLLFMGDIVGRLFREFAITLAVTILVSAVVSLTLTPMMCAKLLKHTPEVANKAGSIGVRGACSTPPIEYYGQTLQWVLRHQDATLMVAVGTLVLTVVLYVIAPKGFFPIQDTGVIQGVSEAPATVSFPAMAQRPAGVGASNSARPGGREPVVVYRNRRDEHDHQQRALFDQPETAGGAQGRYYRSDRSPTAGIGEGPGHHAVHAAGAGSDGGRSSEPDAVSVQSGRSQCRAS